METTIKTAMQMLDNVIDISFYPIPEAKYSEMHEAYMNGELTTKEFVDWYNDPANYRLELPSNNRSHKYE
jgi:hypothetical protein